MICSLRRHGTLLVGLVTALATVAAVPPSASPTPRAAPQSSAPPASPIRWTDETPDAMIELARARAVSGSAGDATAAIVTILAISDRAEFGLARRVLDEIATKAAAGADVRTEAALGSRMLAADEGSEAGAAADAKLGVVTDLALLGPFRDTGGGLDAKDGPEASPSGFADTRARYAWGTIDVAWRAVPRSYATAQGVPLDLFVHPRKESCSWVATKVTVASPQAIVVRLAASGQARLMFDGVEIARGKDLNAYGRLDRIAAKVDAGTGAHLVAAKVCSGALADEGRVRLRVTDAGGAPLAMQATADIGDVASSAQTASTAPSKANTKPSVAKIKSTPVTTPLAHALSGGGSGGGGADFDAQLDAAVLRTLGGADDLASPRAPGSIATIARTPELDADRLAMLAWIAPSGAQRSGWLNQARARANDTKDLRTMAFVDRRLIAQHLEARLADWAMAARLGMKLDAKTDTEATLLAAKVDAAMGTDAHRLAAMHSLAAVAFRANAAPAASPASAPATQAPQNNVPSALLRELAQMAAPFDAARALAARAILAGRGEPSASWVEASSARGKDAVAQAARVTFDSGLDGADEGLATARAVSSAGAHDVARDLYRKLVSYAPNRAEAWSGLAEEIAVTSGGERGERAPNDTAATVQAALRRARELAPGDARTRAELTLRQRPGATTESRDDERYLVPSTTVLAKRQGVPAAGVAPDVAERELYWLRAVVMHPDKRVSQLIHYAREIVIAPRTQDELFEEIPAEGEQTEILRARVHRKGGGTAFPTEEHNEGTRPKIRWPELSPGDTVEVAIRTWTGGPVGGRGDPPFYFLDYAGAQTTHPLLYNEVVVEASPQHPIYLDVINGKPDRREEKDENGRHVTRLVWDKPMLVADEPLSPATSEIVPMIVASTFKDWSDFRAWYNEAVRGFTDPDDEVKRLAADLTKGKTTRDEKLSAIFNFVADNIRYVNFVSGEWWLPNRPQQLLARREGDCDDKAILLITLLRAVGIEAQEVMVQTRLTGQPSILLAKGAAIPLFDHGIAFLPGPNGGTFLDATSPQSRLGPLPSMDARGMALRMDAGPAEMVQLPASSPMDHGADVSWTITMHPDGSGDLAAEETHIGDGAFWLRSYLTEAGARAQYVEDRLVYGWFPSVEVDKNIDFKGDLPRGRAWVRYKAKSQGLARHEGGDMVVPLSQSATLASQLAPLVKRTLPVSLPSYLAPSHETRTIRVVAPKGFAWAALPPGGDEDGGPFGRAHLEVVRDARDPRTVVIKRSVVFDQSIIPVDKYAAWRAWIQRVDALMHKGVRLLPEGAR
jgi:hypothetical protein